MRSSAKVPLHPKGHRFESYTAHKVRDASFAYTAHKLANAGGSEKPGVRVLSDPQYTTTCFRGMKQNFFC
ncbi:MAG: hypothetical protein JXA96_01200, partial [Sedimentisphaerales bacterium]|nr:hypothetical protein [Sedimentisphaerales bacterium]